MPDSSALKHYLELVVEDLYKLDQTMPTAECMEKLLLDAGFVDKVSYISRVLEGMKLILNRSGLSNNLWDHGQNKKTSGKLVGCSRCRQILPTMRTTCLCIHGRRGGAAKIQMPSARQHTLHT